MISKYYNDKTRLYFSRKDSYNGYKIVLDLISSINVKGLSRDIMVYDVFKKSLEEDPKIYEKLEVEYLSLFDYSFFKDELSNLKQLSESSKIQKPELNHSDNNSILNEIKERFKGKIVYLDIWATWCGPCLNEMPSSLKMRNHFNSKEFEFVYLCLQSTKDNGRKQLKE